MGPVEQRETANEYWRKHAATHSNLNAIHVNHKWQRYHAWTRRMLQSWTMNRVRKDRDRFQRVCDIGCGIGDWTEMFATVADEVHACDVAPPFVEQTRARVPSAHVVCADVQSYELPKDLDLVYFGAVLMYVPDVDVIEFLKQVRANVKPGALVIWRDYSTFNFGRRTVNELADRYSIHREPKNMIQLAEQASLLPVEMRSSPSIYGEVMGGRILQWPARALWRLATVTWARATHTLVLRA